MYLQGLISNSFWDQELGSYWGLDGIFLLFNFYTTIAGWWRCGQIVGSYWLVRRSKSRKEKQATEGLFLDPAVFDVNNSVSSMWCPLRTKMQIVSINLTKCFVLNSFSAFISHVIELIIHAEAFLYFIYHNNMNASRA